MTRRWGRGTIFPSNHGNFTSILFSSSTFAVFLLTSIPSFSLLLPGLHDLPHYSTPLPFLLRPLLSSFLARASSQAVPTDFLNLHANRDAGESRIIKGPIVARLRSKLAQPGSCKFTCTPLQQTFDPPPPPPPAITRLVNISRFVWSALNRSRVTEFWFTFFANALKTSKSYILSRVWKYSFDLWHSVYTRTSIFLFRFTS